MLPAPTLTSTWRARTRKHLVLAGLRAAPTGTSAAFKRPCARAPAIHRTRMTTVPFASQIHRAPGREPSNGRLRTILPLAGLAVLASGLGGWVLFHRPSHNQSLSHWMDPDRFSAFRLARKETVPSSNLIFLTVVPEKAYASPKDRLDLDPSLFVDRPVIARHVHLCSVETMHPLAQIAREYTPLETGYVGGLPALTLAVRVYPDGEMSRYLDSIPVGGEIRLRGPYQRFDVPARMGGDAADREMVLVAGGTGILPALRVLEGICSPSSEKAHSRPSKITVLWALRAKSDLYLPAPSVSSAPPPLKDRVRVNSDRESSPSPEKSVSADLDLETGSTENVARLSPIGNRLAVLKQKLGPALDVTIFLDKHGRCSMTARDLEQAMGLGGSGDFSNASSSARLPPPTSTLCVFHNPALTPKLGKNDMVVVRDRDGGLATAAATCKCSSGLGVGGEIHQGAEPVAPPGVGRNVLVVSGPDGFVDAVAGRMVYVDNVRCQGPVTGMVGAVARGHGGVKRDWVVLKLDG